MRNTFTVVYRIGGTANAEWKRTLAFRTYQEGADARDEIQKGGREAVLYRTDLLDLDEAEGTFQAYGPTHKGDGQS